MSLPEIDKVQRDHELRKLECRKLPKKRRGRRERLTPNTSLISHAANAKSLWINVEPKLADNVPGRLRE